MLDSLHRPCVGGDAVDVVVIGGGQAGLAAAYHLRRFDLSHVVLDAAPRPGGAWPATWPSLRLFSPAEASSLPGWPMPASPDGYPARQAVVEYLARYEERYRLPVCRPVRVRAVRTDGDQLLIDTDAGAWRARAVISATGTAGAPHVPQYPGQDGFVGRQLHSAGYRGATEFRGQRVLVVGGGNSAAQILAELSGVADTTWVTRRPPRFMADDVDGRALFAAATERQHALESGHRASGVRALGDIVMVAAVKDARDRGVLARRAMFARLVPDGAVWPDGRFRRADSIVWCTGFRPALEHLRPLGVLEPNGHVAVEGTRSIAEAHLWLLGYGDWTGFASATLIGVGRGARQTVREIGAALASPPAGAALERP
jgi:putative flavoprotein involved in K+ transport